MQKQISVDNQSIYIYIYIYISKDLMWEYMRFFPSDTFYSKRIEIFSSATSEIKTN